MGNFSDCEKRRWFSCWTNWKNPSKAMKSPLPDTELKPLIVFKNLFCDRTRNAPKDDKWIYTLGYPLLQKK